MGLIGLAIGQANVKMKERIRKKANKDKEDRTKYEKAKKAEAEAKRKFEKYVQFEEKVYGTIALGVIMAIESPVHAVKGVKLLVSKTKEKTAQRKAEKNKENQEQQLYESEKEIAEACAKIIEKATTAENLTPHTPTGNNRTKVARELLSQKGLNPDSIATVFGKRIKQIATFNKNANVVFICYNDDEGKKHHAFLERNLETGNFYMIADLTSEKAQQRIIDAVTVFNAKQKKEKGIQVATRLKEGR